MAEISAATSDAVSGGRGAQTWGMTTLIYVGALLVGLVAGGIMFAAEGANPLDAYGTLLSNALGSSSAIAQTLNKMTPLLLGAAAVSLGMRGGYLNIGVDGQIYGGAILAFWAAVTLDGAPRLVSVVVPLIAAVVGGSIFAAVPAFLRYWRGINEFFVTVMLNFVGMYLAQWLANTVWNDPLVGSAVSKPIPASSDLPQYGSQGGHVGIIIAIVLAVALEYWLSRTRRGYELNSMSGNPVAARMAGVSRLMVISIALIGGGAIAGLAGGIVLTGAQFEIYNGLSPNYGYMAVLAAVLARRNTLLCIPVCFGLAVLLVGTNALQATIHLPASAVLLLEGVIVLAILAGESLGRRIRSAVYHDAREVAS